MTYHHNSEQLSAPCIVESGVVINKQDMLHLLNDVKQVKYVHILDEQVVNEGEGWIKEVFDEALRSTIVANNKLYINLQSFEYMKIEKSQEGETGFNLIQDNRQLKIIPLKTDFSIGETTNLDAATLEVMLNQVLSARWDVQLDEQSDDEEY